METGVYWVEYVARHKGAPHMHSAGQKLSWISYHNIDVYAFLALVVYTICYTFKRLFYCILAKAFGARKSVNDKKKRN